MNDVIPAPSADIAIPTDRRRLEIPLSLLLEVYRHAPADVRCRIDEWLRDYKSTIDRKGHTVEGIIKHSDGTLGFDERLYDEAVYRGKTETYTRAAQEKIEALKGSLELLRTMSGKHQSALSQVSDGDLAQRVGRGLDLSAEARELLGRMNPLLALESTDDEAAGTP